MIILDIDSNKNNKKNNHSKNNRHIDHIDSDNKSSSITRFTKDAESCAREGFFSPHAVGVWVGFNCILGALGKGIGLPKDHINTRISHVGSKPQYHGDTRNTVLWDPYVYGVFLLRDASWKRRAVQTDKTAQLSPSRLFLQLGGSFLLVSF